MGAALKKKKVNGSEKYMGVIANQKKVSIATLISDNIDFIYFFSGLQVHRIGLVTILASFHHYLFMFEPLLVSHF